MKITIIILLLTLLLTPAIGWADTIWTVDYALRGDISQVHTFYGPGAWMFLLTPDYVTVYLQVANNWQFEGFYGQVALPESLPSIIFPPSTDVAVAVATVTEPTVAMPEPASLLLVGFGVAGVAAWRYARKKD